MAGLAPRDGAFELLAGVLDRGRPLSEVIETPFHRDLAPADRAAAHRLATSVLRQRARLDALLERFVAKPPPAAALHVLRLAAAELLIDGAAPHGVVNAAVSLMRARGGARRAGLANAVGRRIAREGPAIWEALPPEPLPDWIERPLVEAIGREAADAVAAACRTVPPLDLTPRDRGESSALAERLGAVRLPTGSLRLTRPGQVSNLPGFAGGEWWVQDAAAAVPARLLGDVSGAQVLDLCAAPGGKTLQLAAAGAEVTALDVSPDRLSTLSDNLDRTGLNATLVAADARKWRPEARFDAILLDAPCSATGTLRRHPDLPYVRRAPDLAPLLKLQATLLDRAADWLVPGGRLVYATCSLLPAEGEAQTRALLERRPDVVRAAAPMPDGIEPAWLSPEGDLRLRPDHWSELGGMDGFFATMLTRA
ncbi:MAG: transcription antitermination factor NusB [Pseudomonadota bacterium]